MGKNKPDAAAVEESSARPDSGPTAWTLNVAAGPASDFATAAKKAEPVVTAPSAEGRAQIAAAIEVATALVAIVQPDGEKSVAATLSGFANPGSTAGTAGTVDQITVKVRQA